MIPNRLVLDTNVCLDLFVFEDPRWATLAAALRDGEVEAVTRADCRNEWRLVLAYPQFGLTPERQAHCIARFDAAITCVSPVDGLDEFGTAVAPLPRCTDADDQKFLEIARDARAAVLVTKDKALLKLAGKCRRVGMFAIVTPEGWMKSPQADAVARAVLQAEPLE
jgi:putative PIN family toxin of toxin-antitoxin system